MNEIKVSVIIPVYNTEKYLKESIDSILNQTLREIEVIAIDGSTDSSPLILHEYARKDSRVKVIIEKVNKGLSAARNIGLSERKGEFVYFFDSDDVLDLDCLELCYNKAKEENLDILFFDADVFYDDGYEHTKGFAPNYRRTNDLKPKTYTGYEIYTILTKKKTSNSVVWLNFIKSSYLAELQLEFYPDIYSEDELFTPQLYISAERVGFIPRTFFHRRMRGDSLMGSKMSEKKIEDRLFVVSELQKLKLGIKEKGKKKMLNFKSRQILHYSMKKIFYLDFAYVLKTMPKIIKLYFKSL